MKEPYLEVTYRHGRPFAAYYYLPRRPGQRCTRSARIQAGLIIDYASSGQPIGIEITAPAKLSATTLNRVLRKLGFQPVSRADLAPLRAA